MSGPFIAIRLFDLCLEDVFPDEVKGAIYRIDDGYALAETGVWSSQEAQDCLDSLLAEFADRDRRGP